MTIAKTIIIGTRASELALWQAEHVKAALEARGHSCEVKAVKASGDINLTTPLYQFGITGIFTRHLDAALVSGDIDIAVHSMKDVPTLLARGTIQAAVMKRADSHDVLVYKDGLGFLDVGAGVVATGSLRRRAAWLHKYPSHTMAPLRGNVNTRLAKIGANNWNGAIFAAAGLARLGKLPQQHLNLGWMVPAPAQGAVMIAARSDDADILAACHALNHNHTQICTDIERGFLSVLEGGCTAPIGALAVIGDKDLQFHGVLYSRCGKHKVHVKRTAPLTELSGFARSCAAELLANGGAEIMAENAAIAAAETPIKILSTKLLTDEQARQCRGALTQDAFIKIELRAIPQNTIKSPAIFTSRNAVRAVLASTNTANLGPIYCVGTKTKTMIEDALGPVAHMANSAKALANYLADNDQSVPVTFFCGNRRRAELPDILRARGVVFTEVTVYHTELTPSPAPENLDAVLFFSPSAIHSFLEANAPPKLAICIGPTTAATAREHIKNVLTAETASIESVIELANKHFGL